MEAPSTLLNARRGRPFAPHSVPSRSASLTPDHPVNFLRASSTAVGVQPITRPSRRRSKSFDLTAITSASTRLPSRRRSQSLDLTSFPEPTPPSRRRSISNLKDMPQLTAPHLTPPSSRRSIGEFEGVPKPMPPSTAPSSRRSIRGFESVPSRPQTARPAAATSQLPSSASRFRSPTVAAELIAPPHPATDLPPAPAPAQPKPPPILLAPSSVLPDVVTASPMFRRAVLPDSTAQPPRKMPTAVTGNTESSVVGQEPSPAGTQNDGPAPPSEIRPEGFRKAIATADEGGATSEARSQCKRVGPAVSTIVRVADELARARLEKLASQQWEERMAGRRAEWAAKKAATAKAEAEVREREAEAKALEDLVHHPNPLVQVPGSHSPIALPHVWLYTPLSHARASLSRAGGGQLIHDT